MAAEPATAGRRAARRCSRSRRARPTPCATGTWSTWCRPGSASTRSTTSGASRSSCPPGASPAGAGSRASCGGRSRLVTTAERTLNALPLRGQPGRAGRRPRGHPGAGRAGHGLRRALRRLRRVRGHLRRRPAARRWGQPRRRPTGSAFCFDPRVIDWARYVRDVHLPSVVGHARVRTTPGGRTTENRGRPAAPPGAGPRAPLRRLRPGEHAGRLERGRVLRLAGHPSPRRGADRARFVAKTLAEAPVAAARWTRRDRCDFLRYFYRRYEGAPVGQLRDGRLRARQRLLLPRAFPAGLRRVREHRRAGHRTVLITGALDFVIEPAPAAVRRHGRGRDEPAGRRHLHAASCWPPRRPESRRAQALFDYAAAHGFDPAEGVAYADSTSDLPMLEAVGFPVAVNPETRLAALARKRGWLVEHFERAPGRPRLPCCRWPPAAPSRMAVTPRAIGAHPPRLRAGGRRFDAADPLPPRRGLPPRAAAAGPLPGHLPPRAAARPARPRRRHPPCAAATPWRLGPAVRAAAARG